MYLINCPDCGKEVSNEARRCPNCGCPIPMEEETKELVPSQPWLSPEDRYLGHISACKARVGTNNRIIREMPIFFLIVLGVLYAPYYFFNFKLPLFGLVPFTIWLLYLLYSKKSDNAKTLDALREYEQKLKKLK